MSTLIRRMIALFLLFMSLLSRYADGEIYPIIDPVKHSGVINDISADGNLAPSVLYAADLRNTISASFTTCRRDCILIKNKTLHLQQNLTPFGALATMKNIYGNAYFENTLDCFYTDANGRHNASESYTQGRINTIRLGEYYYETHVRDLDFCKSAAEQKVFGLDQCYHVYADRLYLQCSLLAAEATTALQTFGTQLKIAKKTVSALQINDKNGNHSSLGGVDGTTVTYAAFDITDVGVVGFIVPNDGSCKSLTVTEENGYYVITALANFTPGTGINKYDETGGYSLNCVTFGMRIWNDTLHSFDRVEKAALQERNPLQGITVYPGNSNAYYIGYEALRGTYTLHMDGTDFNVVHYDAPHQFQVPMTITCDDEDREIMIRSFGALGCLEAAALLDGNGQLSAMETEVCKNFMGDGGEAFYSAKDYQYGDTFFPLSLKANETLHFTLLNLYYSWGQTPLKQISSIEFHVSYYHLSTGTTESNCIAPYFVYGRDGWTLPDFRTRSGTEWELQPQYNSVGILRFVTHRNAAGTDIYSEFQNSRIDSVGFAYADVTNEYVSDCGSYRYSLRHVEMPQTDENRTYYTVKITFDEAMSFSDFRNDFDLFNFNGRFVDFEKLDYLNSNNQPASADVSATQTKTYTLGTQAPYFGFYQITSATQNMIASGLGSNFALLIKNSKMVICGQETVFPFAVRQYTEAGRTAGALTLDAGRLSFQAGDSITMNLILLPWGIGTETEDSNVLAVREDSILNPPHITPTIGTAVQDDYVPTIKAENNTAEFTLTGGRNNLAVKVTNVTDYAAPTVQKMVEGQWQTVNLASRYGYDGYTVKYEDNGTYSYSFVVSQDSPDSAVTLRFSTQGE